jgi:hypothetical protein
MDPNTLVDVSAQLGHSNLMTTQRYYAQITAESAGSRLEKAWSGNKDKTRTQSKPRQGEALDLLLHSLGITPEELATRLITNAHGTTNTAIAFKERLTGYN